MFRTWLFVIILLITADALAAGIDLAADTITRDPYGAIVAEGDVVIKRKDETLKADQLIYDSEHKKIKAQGHIVVESGEATIEAESASLHTVEKTGELHNARATLKSGERLSADTIVRKSQSVMQAEGVTFSSCPPGSETWRMRAASAELDQDEGVLTAKHARLELGGIPLLYTPYWYQVLRRKSGMLLPFVSTGKVRGTEYALPLYLAPADNWDATLTPHWMTARGLMGEAEFRYASRGGYTRLYAEGLKDKKTSTQRSRLKADIDEALPFYIPYYWHGRVCETRQLGPFIQRLAPTQEMRYNLCGL